MKDFADTFSSDAKTISVLAIPGILSCKPTDDPFIGRAWPKKAKNGRSYYKFKFDCFVTRSGKTFYAKGLPRKSEPGSFSINAEELPFAARYPLLLDKNHAFRFKGMPCDDGSVILMMNHDFVGNE